MIKNYKKFCIFWDKVAKCEHVWSKTYSEHVQGCRCNQAEELHCTKCKVYMTEDPCYENYGFSGWSQKRWKNRYRKINA